MRTELIKKVKVVFCKIVRVGGNPPVVLLPLTFKGKQARLYQGSGNVNTDLFGFDHVLYWDEELMPDGNNIPDSCQDAELFHRIQKRIKQ